MNTRQTAQSGTTHKVQKYRFHRVITVVSHTDSSSPNILTQLFKPFITQFASCHFNAYLVQLGIFTGIEMSTMQFYTKSLAEIHTKSLVPIRFFASQMKITMSRMHVEMGIF